MVWDSCAVKFLYFHYYYTKLIVTLTGINKEGKEEHMDSDGAEDQEEDNDVNLHTHMAWKHRESKK